MTQQEFFKSNAFKVLLIMFVAVGLINVFRAGYHFGQWLYAFLH
jgi:uncharacterized membrane protein